MFCIRISIFLDLIINFIIMNITLINILLIFYNNKISLKIFFLFRHFFMESAIISKRIHKILWIIFGQINDIINDKYDFMDFMVLYHYFLFPKN